MGERRTGCTCFRIVVLNLLPNPMGILLYCLLSDCFQWEIKKAVPVGQPVKCILNYFE